jgi:hypothetical protein
MQRRYFAVLSLIALSIPGMARAASSGKPKEEKTKGEIVSIGDDRLQLKTKKATVMVLLAQKPSSCRVPRCRRRLCDKGSA